MCSICGLPTPSQIHRNLFRLPQVESSLLENPLLRRLRRVTEEIGPPIDVLRNPALSEAFERTAPDLSANKGDAVIPVPFHPGNLKERELKQTALLGLQL